MALTIDGDDLKALGWRLMRHGGLDAGPTIEVPTTTLPGLGVESEVSGLASARPRRFSVTWGYKASTYAALESALAGLKARLYGRSVVVATDRRPGQQITARVADFPVTNGVGAQDVAPYWLEAEVGFVAVSPYWEDATAQVVAFGTSAVALPQGTVATEGILLLTASGGSVVDPTLTYKTSAGVAVATVPAVITIANGDAIEIDVTRETVRKRVGGVWSNAASALAVGFTWPVFSPLDGSFITSSWPTMQVSASSGAALAAGSATYRRRWA